MKSTNHYFKPLGLLLLLCLIPLCAFSQNVTVKGIVKDALGESVIGASVVEKELPMVLLPVWMEILRYR